MKTEDAKSIVIAAIPTNIPLGGVKGLKPGEFNSQKMNHEGNIQEISVTDIGPHRPTKFPCSSKCSGSSIQEEEGQRHSPHRATGCSCKGLACIKMHPLPK